MKKLPPITRSDSYVEISLTKNSDYLICLVLTEKDDFELNKVGKELIIYCAHWLWLLYKIISTSINWWQNKSISKLAALENH